MTGRAALQATLLVLAAAATALALGAPRFTWENDGLRVDHPPQQAAAAALASAGVIGATWSARPRAVRAAGFAAAAALVALAANRLAWRVEAVDAGLRERTVSGWSAIPWSDVEAVEASPAAIQLRGRKGQRLEVATRGFSAEDRTRLERTVARRIREAAPPR